MQHLGPRAAAYALACLFALALACDLLWMPIQVADSIGEILDAQHSSSTWASFTGSFGTESYLRPFRIAQIKALFDAAQERHYWLVYRGFHAALAVAALLLFVRALCVTTAAEFAAAAFALVVLVGLHTFRGTVQEAFPINHFLEILLFCLIALNLTQSRGGVWVDVGAALTFAIAALTLESGLLVWVVAASAWAVGWRGVSSRGLAVMTVLLLAYVYMRFFHLATGVPTLTERSSGYLLDVLDPQEIERRFGARPLWFYTYNVLASISSVLFSEPQAGVFEAVRTWLNARPLPRVVIPVVTSIVTTALMMLVAVRRAPRWRSLDDAGRLIVIFVAVLIGSAMLSFAYTKDEIMSTAGAFYALAAYGAVRDTVLFAAGLRRAAAVGCALLLSLLAIGWSVRTAGVHYVLRSQAGKHQIDWIAVPDQWNRDRELPTDPADLRLMLQLREDALLMRLPNTRLGRPEWPDRLWID